MAIDLTTLTDEELDKIGDDALREKSRRFNEREAPLRVRELESDLTDNRPKTKLAGVKVEQDVDGRWVVVDFTGVDPDVATPFLTKLANEGAQFVTPTKIRHGASAFVKEGGHFEQLEALL